MKYHAGAFRLYPLMVIGMMPLCLGGVFKGDFTTQFLVYIKNEPSCCMNNCLCEFQLYDRDYLFCKYKPNKISVSSSLSHMTNVWENLKLAIQKCKVALPSEDSDDPSAVLSCTAAGSILVL